MQSSKAELASRTGSTDTLVVLWWFERNGKHTRIEVLHPPGQSYELHFVDTDGAEVVEHFDDLDALRRRQQELHDQLIATGWTRSGEWLL